MMNEVREPMVEMDGTYTYADYLTWTMDEVVEIIKGRIFRMSAAPKSIHQRLTIVIGSEFEYFLKNKKCKVFVAPFDVRLPVNSNGKGSKNNSDIKTVVQPDICVICDPSKLDEAGCIGAPDLIVEILSKSTTKKDLQYKYEVYEESGVLQYWIIWPEEETLLIYTLMNGKYQPSRIFTKGDKINTHILPGFELDLEEVFDGL